MHWQLFDNLRSEQPQFTSKVFAVSGNIADEGLGLEDDQKTYLEENINVVFHSAATVKFDEPLKYVSTALSHSLLVLHKLCL